MKASNPILAIVMGLVFCACSTTPMVSHESLTVSQAKAFLDLHCSKSLSGIRGELLVRSSTREFKGQYPASILFSDDGSFVLEVTHLLGGTLAMLKGNANSVDVVSSLKPKYNQKGIHQYMGLQVRLLAQLLHGDLPCPARTDVQVDGALVLIQDGLLQWQMELAGQGAEKVPYRIKILDGSELKMELVIERWNQEKAYAEKVKVVTPEGDLKWTWRSRN
jgi:hypothetical protein